jgi:hypothetical protein
MSEDQALLNRLSDLLAQCEDGAYRLSSVVKEVSTLIRHRSYSETEVIPFPRRSDENN